MRSEIEAWVENADGLRLVEKGDGYELEEING